LCCSEAEILPSINIDPVEDPVLLFRAGITFDGMVQLLAFCLFEVMVGLFWPSMMKMRAEYVPEEMRATIINFFRIPLNLFVCIILYNVRLGIVSIPTLSPLNLVSDLHATRGC
jgi:hypothetical protein